MSQDAPPPAPVGESTGPGITEGPNAFGSWLKSNWAALILVILAVVFIAQNREQATVRLFVTDVTAPLWVLFSILLIIGIFSGLIMSSRRRKRKETTGKKRKK